MGCAFVIIVAGMWFGICAGSAHCTTVDGAFAMALIVKFAPMAENGGFSARGAIGLSVAGVVDGCHGGC